VAPILTIAAAGWLGPSWLGIGATPTPTPTLGVTPCAIAASVWAGTGRHGGSGSRTPTRSQTPKAKRVVNQGRTRLR